MTNTEYEYYHGIYDPETQSIIKVPFTEEEILQRKEQENINHQIFVEEEWKKLRIKRNELLLRCDWTQLLDNNLTEEERVAWTLYREQLRNLPNTLTEPFDVIWPIPPKEILYQLPVNSGINNNINI